MSALNVEKIREDFPALHQKIYGKPLVYFDNAATSQKPRQVIERIKYYYEKENSNIHRGVHYLSQKATEQFEEARKVVRKFINAEKEHEIIFTKGTTDALNLVRYSYGKHFISKGDEIIISAMEHHSNLVPWQMLCKEKGAKLKVIPINDKGELLFDEFVKLIGERTKLVALVHISNILGTINDIKQYIRKAHETDIPVIIDGAQAVMHQKVDVRELDCYFYCFSGHKMYAPMGGGILYGKESLLEKMPPFQLGGEMVDTVTYEKTTFNELPFNFEAGTPNVEAIIGLKAAINYIESIGLENLAEYEKKVLDYATEKLLGIEGLRIIGTASHKASLISFLIGDIHPYDAGTIIDKMGVAVRTGHHCAQPVLEYYNIPGTVRASFVFYNTIEEVDRLVDCIYQVKRMLE